MAKNTAMTYNNGIVFVEAPIFSKRVYDYLNEDEYVGLQLTLVIRPEAGKVIPGSGGLRKIRWSAKGQGKRSGTRIIYYFQKKVGQIWLLTIYAKNEVEKIPTKILREIKETLEK